MLSLLDAHNQGEKEHMVVRGIFRVGRPKKSIRELGIVEEGKSEEALREMRTFPGY